MTDLGGDASSIAWYPAAYTLALCALTPVAGKLATVFPLDLVYSCATTIFLVGSIVCGWAPNSGAFIAGRALAGIGAAGIASNGLTILVTVAPVPRRPQFMGLGSVCYVLGLVTGPLVSGAFTDRATWRWCFWINIPVNVITLTVVSCFFRPKRVPRPEQGFLELTKSLDVVGCLIFVPGIFMLLLALQLGGESGQWGTATIIGLLVGSVMTLLLFVAWEWRQGDTAMIPGSLAFRRTVLFTCLFAFLQMGGLFISPYYLPPWFQLVQGVGPLESGVRMLATVIAQMIATVIASSLATRLRYYNPWFFLAPIFMITSSALYTTLIPTTGPNRWIGYQVIQGFGTGFGMQMASLVVQLEMKDTPKLVPIGIALVMFTQYLGATVIQLVAGTVFNRELNTQLASVDGLTPQMLASLLGSGIRGARVFADSLPSQVRDSVLEAYNTAITRVFYVPLASAAAAFFAALGIKWTKIEGAAAGSGLAQLRAARAAAKKQKKEDEAAKTG